MPEAWLKRSLIACKMRIGIEAQRIFRSHKHGMDVVALELIKALQELDKINEYFIFVKNDEDTACLKATPNFHIVTLPNANYIYWEQVLLPRYVKNYKIDVLHCTGNTAPLWLSCPVILTLHDVIFLERRKVKNTSSLYQKLGNFYRRLLVPRLIHKVDEIITISYQEKERICLALTTAENKISVIHNGVSTLLGSKYLPEKAKNISEKLGLNDEFVLFLGNTEPRKNTPNVLKAFALLAAEKYTLKLVITGLTAEFIENHWPQEAPKEFLNRIITPGYVSQAELHFLYEYATFYLFPSLREGFGLPILEAMSFGTPVITSNVSSMPEVAGEAALLVNPEDPKQIAKAMELLLDDPGLRESLACKGLQRVKAFSWENTAKAYLQLYLKNQHSFIKQTPALH